MSSNQNLPIKFSESATLTIPEFDSRPAIVMEFKNIVEGERRLVEAKLVNAATYSELEFVYNEGYREAKKYLSLVQYEIAKAKQIIRRVKSEFLLDEYPAFLKEKRLNDNSANREAFLERQGSYVAATDRLDMLLALESLLEGKIKVFENVCRYMKKQMDILIRSGSINYDKY